MSNNLPANVEPDLKSEAKDLQKQTARDHVVNVIKATVSGIPVVGGPVASLMSDYIPNSRVERLEQFAKDLADDMTRVHDKLNVDYVRTDEYAFLVTRVFEDVARDYQEDKLRAYRNILVNGLRFDVRASIQEAYLNRVENLTPLHLQLLSCFVSDEDNAKKLPDATQSYGSSGSIRNTLQILLPDFPRDQLAACAHDLDIQGITGNLASSLTTMMTAHGAQELANRLTPFGRGFVDFITAWK